MDMNGNRIRNDRNDAVLVKRLVLSVIGLTVVVGVGVLAIGRSGPRPRDSKLAAIAKDAASSPAPMDEAAVTTEPVVMEPAPVVEAATAAEPTAPATWAEAQAAWDTGDWKLAADRFASYTDAHEGNVWGWFMTGLALRQDERFAEAEAALEQGLAIDPDHGKSLVALARVRLSLDRAGDALAPVEAAVTGDPENVDARRVLGRVLHTLGRVDEAEAAYLAALAIDPDDAWANNNLGLLRIEGERFAEAVEPLERACAAGPGQATFFNNLGVALERTGDYRAAEEAYAAAVELGPEKTKALVSLARVRGLGSDMGDPTGDVLAETPAEVVPDSTATGTVAIAGPALPGEDAQR
jgi:tetratricopeptide (TPR) repeat protein